MEELRKVYDQLQSHGSGRSHSIDLRPFLDSILEALQAISEGQDVSSFTDPFRKMTPSSSSLPKTPLLQDAVLIRELNISFGETIPPAKEYVYGYKDLCFEEFCSYIYWRTRIRNEDESILSNTPKAFMYLYLFELCNFVEKPIFEDVLQTLMWLLEHTGTSIFQIVKDAVYEFILLYSESNFDDSWIFSAYSDRFDHVIRANAILNGDLSGILDYITSYSTKSSIFANYGHLINNAFPIAIMQANQYLEQKGIPFLELWFGKTELLPMRLRFIKEISKEKLKSKEISRFGTVFINVTDKGIFELSWVSLGQQSDPGQCVFARSYVMRSFYSLFEIELRKMLSQRTIRPQMADMKRMSSHSSVLMKLYQEFESPAFRECLSKAIKSAI